MNIEIANRLVELRKKNGLSQEELALKLGISRQAVSKWERAESSPDTDNLICLAKLYNVSLDSLLNTSESVLGIVNNDSSTINKEEELDKVVNIGLNGIYVKKGNKEVNVGLGGIHVKNKDSKEVTLDSKNYESIDVDFDSVQYNLKKRRICRFINDLLFLLTVVAYIVLGALFNTWHPDWLLFLDVLVLMSIVDSIAYKNILKFNVSILAVVIYLYLGIYLKLWNPSWVVFLIIPIFYMVAPKRGLSLRVITKDGKADKRFTKPSNNGDNE